MKNSTITNSIKKNLLLFICTTLLIGLLSDKSYSQEYRYINAYMVDFGKNEMFINKSLMDYSISIVENQLTSRSKMTAGKIIEKLESLNTNLRNNNKGFENNTLLRDSFIKMNLKTIESLLNGSLILNDYEYQSTLSLEQIGENFIKKARDQNNYYQELRNYDKSKKAFGHKYNMSLKINNGKNVLEYNANQNMLFYKTNVIDQKLTSVIAARDKKGFFECLNSINEMHNTTIENTTLFRDIFKDNSLNDANIQYSNFINSQKSKFANLFNDYVDGYNELQTLKNSTTIQTRASVEHYNTMVRNYNTKKNLFYEVYYSIQSDKKVLYDNWFISNSTFLKNNGEFDNIHDAFVVSE